MMLSGESLGEICLVMGDFNARVGNDCSTWSRNIGKFGAPEVVNDNGLRLLEYCVAPDIVVTGIYFQHKKVHTYTWYQRGTQFRSQIDHILIRPRWSARHIKDENPPITQEKTIAGDPGCGSTRSDEKAVRV